MVLMKKAMVHSARRRLTEFTRIAQTAQATGLDPFNWITSLPSDPKRREFTP